MHEAEKLSLGAIGRFVEASEEIHFEGANRSQVYGWVERVLVRQEYAQQGKAGRGLLRRSIEKMTGLSRAQVTRLMARYAASGRIETKNGAIIRKHMDYGYSGAGHAGRINSFYREFLNPGLNYHRPCAQADVEIDHKGRKRVRYKRYQTPLETLPSLDAPARYLRQGLSINALKRIAGARSDTDAARRMQQAKNKLCEKLRLTAWDRKMKTTDRGNDLRLDDC